MADGQPVDPSIVDPEILRAWMDGKGLGTGPLERLEAITGGTQNLPWLVGEGWAKRMILCGERIKADKALSIGLVEEVVPQGAALDKALELAEMAGKQSPSSVARCKTLVMSARDGRSHDDGWRMERELFIELFSTEDQREGVNAFLEKRTPEWKNR